LEALGITNELYINKPYLSHKLKQNLNNYFTSLPHLLILLLTSWMSSVTMFPHHTCMNTKWSGDAWLSVCHATIDKDIV